jgi:hypothetical protein
MENKIMLKSLVMGVAFAFLAMTALQSGALAASHDDDPEDGTEYSEGIDDDGPDTGYSVDQEPDCDWIKRQVRNVGSAYWKTRYFNDCVSTVDVDD